MIMFVVAIGHGPTGFVDFDSDYSDTIAELDKLYPGIKKVEP